MNKKKTFQDIDVIGLSITLTAELLAINIQIDNYNIQLNKSNLIMTF